MAHPTSFAELLEQSERDRSEIQRLTTAVDLLTKEVSQIHASRNANQESIASAISGMREDHSNLEEQVSKLVVSMRELVIALSGNMGSVGLIGRMEALEDRVEEAGKSAACAAHKADLAELTKRVVVQEDALKEVKGMGRLLGWGGGLITLAAIIKSFFTK